MAPIRLLVARLRQDRLPGLLLIVLVFVTALLAAAAPRLFNVAADAGLRYEIAQASVVERNLQLGRIFNITAVPGEGMGPIAEVENEIESGLPASVRRILSGGSMLAESVVYSVLDRPSTRPGFITLQFQGDLGDEVRLVDGRMPTGTTRRVPAPDLPPGSVPVPEDREGLLFEAALSTVTAEELDVGVGDVMHMFSSQDDPLVGAFGFPEAVAVEVVGLVEITDPGGDYWAGDRGLHEPTLVPVGIDIVLVYATALVSPDAYPATTQLGTPLRYSFRYYPDADLLDAGMVDELVVDLQRMEATYASFATQADETTTTLRTGLLELTNRFLAERRSSEAVLVTSLIGPSAVALAAIAVLALLAVQRRRGALILLRGRGGSGWQLVGSHVVEGLLLAVAPAAGAVLLATAVVEARSAPATSVVAGAVALGTILVLAAAVLPLAVQPLRRIGRETPAGIGASPRRLAFEGLAVGLAIGGVVLLRQRGIAGGSAAGELAGVDPFLAAVPALVGLAVGIVTVRLYPYPVRAAGWIAAAGRGMVPALGLRRAERQGGTGHLPLIVLLLTVAIGTFSSAMLATIDRGQLLQSWQVIGAAHRITGEDRLLATVDVPAIEGVEAVAGAHLTDASVGIAGGGRVRLMALDVADYESVTAGTPIETRLPGALIEPAGEGRPGTTDAPIPAIVSRSLVRSSTTSFRVGETFELTVESRFATFVVVEIRDAMASLRADQAFIVVPRDQLSAGLRDRQLPTTNYFIRAPADAVEAIRAAVAEARSTAAVASQTERLNALRERPLVNAIEIGFTLSLAVAVAYAALAVIISLGLAGSARARETAHLRTMGLARRQVIGLTVIEHAPPVLVAVVAGLLLGVAVSWVALPGLGLGAFTGSAAEPVLSVDLEQLAVLTAVLLAIVAIGVALAAWMQRRADPARAIREGLE